jgi:hypothetical protein
MQLAGSNSVKPLKRLLEKNSNEFTQSLDLYGGAILKMEWASLGLKPGCPLAPDCSTGYDTLNPPRAYKLFYKLKFIPLLHFKINAQVEN